MKLFNLMGLMMILAPVCAFSQAKKPTIMVMPAGVWCNENGYMTSYDMQGEARNIPNYEEALQSDMDLLNVITKIGELMAEQGFPLKDLNSCVRSIRQNSAQNEMLTSRSSGAVLAETPYDRLLNQAKADILVEVTWKINNVGPKNSVTYTLRGIDAYTNKQIAAAQGTGAQSFTAEVPVLLEEAVIDKMDNFISQLQNHFDDLVNNGREVTVSVRLFDNGTGMTFEDEFGGQELTEVIDDWMAENTVNHRYSLTDATDDMLYFEQVRIPLYRDNGMPMDTRHFVEQLRKFLKVAPYNLTAKTITKGLGSGMLVIGEK